MARAGGVSVGSVLAAQLGIPAALAVAPPILVLAVVVPLVRTLQKRQRRTSP